MPYTYTDKLESARLITRFLRREDQPDWTAFFCDKEAIAYFPFFHTLSPEDSSRQWFDWQLSRYANQRYGLQALHDKKTNQLIGQCGLLAQTVDGVEELEVGYHILKKYWGQGYAPEAARLFLDYAGKHKLAESLISIIDVGNMKSQRVAEKNGLIREKKTIWKEMEVYIYRMSL